MWSYRSAEGRLDSVTRRHSSNDQNRRVSPVQPCLSEDLLTELITEPQPWRLELVLTPPKRSLAGIGPMLGEQDQGDDVDCFNDTGRASLGLPTIRNLELP